eukprot:TRINITY_DN40_c0_g2_i1.p1 TRINITY_DN40_c0_g2~~TRINITY_DN40_c0_g2_i1.p1  ORF type:complete len:807 (+),score=193.82 TRINITY_DN40_c0_g2_i1:74-2494(+)
MAASSGASPRSAAPAAESDAGSAAGADAGGEGGGTVPREMSLHDLRSPSNATQRRPSNAHPVGPMSPMGRTAIAGALSSFLPNELRRATNTVRAVLSQHQQCGLFRRAVRVFNHQRNMLRRITLRLRILTRRRADFVNRTCMLWTRREQEALDQHFSAQADLRGLKSAGRNSSFRQSSVHRRQSVDAAITADGPPVTRSSEKERLADLIYETWRSEYVAKWRKWYRRATEFQREWEKENVARVQAEAVARRLLSLNASAPRHAEGDPPPRHRLFLNARELDFLAATNWDDLRREYGELEREQEKMDDMLRTTGDYKDLVRRQQELADRGEQRAAHRLSVTAPTELPPLRLGRTSDVDEGAASRAARRQSAVQLRSKNIPPALLGVVEAEVMRIHRPPDAKGRKRNSAIKELVCAADDWRTFRKQRSSIYDLQRGRLATPEATPDATGRGPVRGDSMGMRRGQTKVQWSAGEAPTPQVTDGPPSPCMRSPRSGRNSPRIQRRAAAPFEEDHSSLGDTARTACTAAEETRCLMREVQASLLDITEGTPRAGAARAGDSPGPPAGPPAGPSAASRAAPTPPGGHAQPGSLTPLSTTYGSATDIIVPAPAGAQGPGPPPGASPSAARSPRPAPGAPQSLLSAHISEGDLSCTSVDLGGLTPERAARGGGDGLLRAGSTYSATSGDGGEALCPSAFAAAVARGPLPVSPNVASPPRQKRPSSASPRPMPPPQPTPLPPERRNAPGGRCSMSVARLPGTAQRPMSASSSAVRLSNGRQPSLTPSPPPAARRSSGRSHDAPRPATARTVRAGT